MKMLVLSVLIVSLVAQRDAPADPWKTDPALKALAAHAAGTMMVYQDWKEDWDGKPDGDDHHINMMTEDLFVNLYFTLLKHPNPELLKECMVFCGTVVPRDYDKIWSFVFIEMGNVDGEVAKEVEGLLKARGLPTLEDRYMNRK